MIRDLLLRNRVFLNLQEVVLLPEDLAILCRRPNGIRHPVLADQERHFAAEAAREPNQAFVMLTQRFLIDPGLVIKAIEIGGARELQQVLIAGPVGGEQNQMIVLVVGKLAFPIKAALGRQIGLAADNGFDTRCRRFLVEIDGPEEITVVGNRHSGHAKAFCSLH